MHLGIGAKLDVTWPADKKIGRAKVGAANAEAVISGPETIRTMTTPKNLQIRGCKRSKPVRKKVRLVLPEVRPKSLQVVPKSVPDSHATF